MIRPIALISVGIAALALAGSAASRPAGQLDDMKFRSAALRGPLRLAVYLPPGYARSRLRYPVVYFLHGLPAGARSYRGIDFLRRALDATGRRALIVAPQGSRDNDTDPEYLDWGPGRRWETAIARDVPRFVDAHFRTIRSRRARAVVGLSAGGYGAVLLTLHHLVSVVESWSGYFHPTDPTRHARPRPRFVGPQRPRERAHVRCPPAPRLHAASHLLCLLRGKRRRSLSLRKRTAAPRTRSGARASRVPRLSRRPRADGLVETCAGFARARARAPRAAAALSANISRFLGDQDIAESKPPGTSCRERKRVTTSQRSFHTRPDRTAPGTVPCGGNVAHSAHLGHVRLRSAEDVRATSRRP